MTFYDNGTAIGTGTLAVGGGLDEATLTTAALPGGTDAITAAYTSGDANFTPSPASAAVNQVVGPDGTTTTVASSPTPSAYGQAVTFTATVTTGGPGTFDNRGTVQFLVDGADYGAPVPLSSGTAGISDSSLAVGTHTITAAYSGDGNFNGSTGSLTQGVTGVVTVTNNLNSGPGSLRAAIAAALSGDTIEFAPSLAGETITLSTIAVPPSPTSGALTINTSLQIEGLGAGELTVSGNNGCTVFDIDSANAVVSISGLSITDGARRTAALLKTAAS